jgi:hypothetical protein
MIDYYVLLKKYIGHVIDCEGTEFIEYWDHPEYITPEEWDALRFAYKALMAERKSKREQ